MNPAILSPTLFQQKKIKFISLFLSVLVGAYTSLFSQATVPILTLPEYESQLMSEVYGESYFMNSITAWTDQVRYYQGLIRSSWEAAADTAIMDYVATITTSDAYNDVAAYKDYIETSLRSQADAALNTWEEKANLDLLTNRNDFLARLETGKIDEIYLDRLVVQSGLGSNIASSPNGNTINSIEQARASWEDSINFRYYQGTAEFANGSAQIEQGYNDTLAALDASEAEFQANLNKIDLYKKNVEAAISSMITGFETDLAKPCTTSDDCAYRYKNNGGFNDAGVLLNKYITDIKAELNKSATDASFSLTDLATKINTFLSDQTIAATGKHTSYNRLVYTYQHSLTPVISDYHSIHHLTLGDWRSSVHYGSYDTWNGLNPGISWSSNFSDLYPDAGVPKTEEFLSSVLPAAFPDTYWPDEQDRVNHFIDNALAGTGRTRQGNVFYNFFTKDTGMANKARANDGFAWVSISKGSFDCNVLNCGDPSPALRGNKILDDAAGVNFSKYRINRVGSYSDYRMDHITYAIQYTVYDSTMQSYTNYWDGVKGSLGNQFNMYSTQITPAVSNWESQVKNYKDFYESWKIQANLAKAQAKIDYDKSMADLDQKRQVWTAKIQDEYGTGLSKWQDLSTKASVASSSRELANLSSASQAILTSANGVDTGASSVLDSYNASLESLANRKFTFAEPSSETRQEGNGFDRFLSSFVKGNVSESLSKGENGIVYTTKMGDVGLELGSVQKISGVATELGALSSAKQTFTSNSYSLFGASGQKTVNTSLTVNGKDISEVFQTTTNGVYQYSQLLSINQNNDRSAIAEQEKIINQQAFGILWENRSVARFDDKGEFKGDAKFKDLLNDLSKNKKGALDRLKALDPNLEFQDGMIVRSLSAEQKKRLDSCYVNPESCTDLLRRDFTVDFNRDSKVLTLSKVINNGRVVGRNAQGEYIAGTERQSRTMTLASVKPVTAPKGKDLFDVWANEDWNDVSKQANNVMNEFFTNGLNADNKQVAALARDISIIESSNERKFQKEKQDLEARDSLIKDLLIAYISGGMAGVKGAIKNKVEDQINSSLAEAWARASGADEDQIAMLTDAISFMRGKLQEKKIRDRANTFSISDPIRSVENLVAKQASALNRVTGGVSGTLIGFVATGVRTVVKTVASAATAVTGAIGTGVAAHIDPMGTAVGEMVKATSKYLDKQIPKMTGAKDAISAIRANEKGLVQKYATNALATSTGLPPEVASNIIGDYVGSQAAKKARRAVAANPLANAVTQVVGVVGGIVKTAAVAFGAKDRDIQKAFREGNQIANAGSVDVTSAEIQSEAYMNQMFGLKSSATSYTSSTPTLKDKKGFTKELFQREAVKQLSVGMSENERAVLNSAFRASVSKREQSKADKKAQANAARSTGILAVTTIVTLGAASVASAAAAAANAATAAGASAATASAAAATAASTAVATGGVMGTIGGAMASIGTFVGASVTTAANVGAAIVNGAVQAIDGSRNGTQGILAGFANGAIGAFTAGGGLDLGKISSSLGTTLTPALKSTALGLGVTYDRQAGWGGMIGIGNASTNANISFSQRGNTTISGSANVPGVKGLQATLSSTTNGATTVGVNLNAGKGPREGWNLGANYDINGGGFSANIGYTDPNSGFGLTSTIDRTGLSTSGQLNGVNLATNGPNGFTMDEINWAERNINLAQDRGNHLEENALLLADGVTDPDSMSPTERNERLGKINADNEYKQLREDGKSDDEIARMTSEQREAALDRINGVFNPDTWATAALATTGTFFAGALAFAGGGGTGTGQTPTNTNVNGPVVVRRREDGEEGSSTHNINFDDVTPSLYDRFAATVGDIKYSTQSWLKDTFSIEGSSLDLPNVNGLLSDNPIDVISGFGNGKITAEVFGKKFGLGSIFDKLNPVKLFSGEVNRSTSGNNEKTSIQERAVKEEQTSRVAEPESEGFTDAKKRLLDTWYDVEVDKKNFPKADLVLKDLLDSPNLSDSDKAYLKEAFENLKKENYNKGKALYKSGTTPDGFKVLKPQEPATTSSIENEPRSNNDIYESQEQINPVGESNPARIKLFEDAKSYPKVDDFRNDRSGKSLKIAPEPDMDTQTHREKIEQIGIRILKDTYFDYDASMKADDFVDKFVKANSLDADQAKALSTKLTTILKDIKMPSGKAYNQARIEYIRANYDRLTVEKLSARYGGQIDIKQSNEKITVLKDGKGYILNQVYYDSQNDNEYSKKLTIPTVKSRLGLGEPEVAYDYRPSKQCSPQSTAIIAEFAGANIKDPTKYRQLVDEISAIADKKGLLKLDDQKIGDHHWMLKRNDKLDKVLKDYGLQLKSLLGDPVFNEKQKKWEASQWKDEAIKTSIRDGKPVLAGGDFDVSPVNGGHRFVIVGYDETGWIVHDVFGNANNPGYTGSGMYVHYDYKKWDIGKGTAAVIEPLKEGD